MIKETNKPEELQKVAIFLPDLTNFFYSEVTTDISNLLRKKGYLPVIFSTLGKNSIEKKYYTVALENNYVSCVFIGGSKMLNEQKVEIPTVLLDRDHMKNKRYPVVTSDNEHGGEIAAKYLIDNGAKKIIVIDKPDKPRSAKRRIEGFVKIVESTKTEHIIIKYDENVILKQINDGANAIFAYSDFEAVEVINLLSRNNINVPNRVQVIGYDNISLGQKIYPSLTSVTRQTDLLAKEIVKLMDEMIVKKEFINKYIKVEDYLIVRESTK